MKNLEKYKKEILEIAHNNQNIAISNGKPTSCACTRCADCDLYSSRRCNQWEIFEWLYKECVEPIELSRLEYEMLKRLKLENYVYLARDSTNLLCAYYSTPTKFGPRWGVEKTFGREWKNLGAWPGTFEFVKWEDAKPVNIESVLSNCIVKEEEE